MPELERWEEKAIGRVNRFENTTHEFFKNRTYESGRSLLNRIAQGAMNLGRGFVEAFGRPLDAHIVNGKDFTEYYGVGSRLGRRIGISAAKVDKGLIDQKDANIFEDLTEKDYEDDLFNRDFTDQQPEPEPKAPEQPKPQEEPQQSYLGNLLTGAGMILGALNPLNLFQSHEPEPEKIALFSDDGPVVEEPSPMAQLDSKQAEVIRQLTAQGANLAGIYFDSMAKLLYFKTLEVASNDKTLTPEQLEAGLTKESIDKNVRQIKNQPAFQNLDKTRTRGLLTRAKNFVEDLRKDPNAINDVHKEYVLLQTDPNALEAAKKAYRTAPTISKEAPAPEKAPVPPPPHDKKYLKSLL